DVGFLPICRSDGAPVGTLTDRDIVLRVVAQHRAYTTQVDDVMTPDVICCRPDDDVTRAEQLMRLNQVSRILCMDDEGQIAGVISLADISQRSEEHTSELQSQSNLVCRLLLEKKKKKQKNYVHNR